MFYDDFICVNVTRFSYRSQHEIINLYYIIRLYIVSPFLNPETLPRQLENIGTRVLLKMYYIFLLGVFAFIKQFHFIRNCDWEKYNSENMICMYNIYFLYFRLLLL